MTANRTTKGNELNYAIAREHARKRAHKYAYDCFAELLTFHLIDAKHVSVELRLQDGVVNRRVIEY